MTTCGSVQEQDISRLEDRLRNLLTGGTPRRNDKCLEKQAVAAGDEWARIWKFEIAKGKKEEERLAALAVAQRSQFQSTLEKQVAEHQLQKLAEVQRGKEAAQQVQDNLAQQERQEQTRLQRLQEKAEQLKRDRQVQLEDRQRRRQLTEARKAEEERQAAAKLAYAIHSDLAAEAESLQRNREAVKHFLLQNEDGKKRKAELAAIDARQDKLLMEQYAKQMDKLEEQRQAQLKKLTEIQNRQARNAAKLPPCKQWIDPAIIEKHLQAKEAAQAAEANRKAEAAETRRTQMIEQLHKQCQDKKQAKETAKHVDDSLTEQYMLQLQEHQEKEREKQRQHLQEKLRLKLELELQMRENAHRRKVAPMSPIEKLINKELLKKVENFEIKGELPSA